MTPENTATIKDWSICPPDGKPASTPAKTDKSNQKGTLIKVIPKTRWVVDNCSSLQ